MDAGEFDLFQCQQELDSELRAAYSRAQAEYGELPLAFEAYADRLLRVLFARLAREDGAVSRARIERALGEPVASDLYLAIACDTMASGSWEALSRRFFADLRAVAIKAGASEAEAEELARELPGSLIHPPPGAGTRTRLGTYDGSGSLFSWMASIARNQLADRHRRSAPSVAPPHRVHTPAEMIVGAETGERLEEALRHALLDLPMRESLLLVWKFCDDLPQHQMAVRLGISEARVSQLMKRTVDRVRASVLEQIRDESSPTWASREELWAALRNIVGQLLDTRRID